MRCFLGSLAVAVAVLMLVAQGASAASWKFIVAGDSRDSANDVNTVILTEIANQVLSQAPEFIIFPGSGDVKHQIENPDPRLANESIADVLRSVGGQIRDSWCGPCFGQGADALKPGQRAITTFNRNWQNRMGVGGEGFLASPAVVAASAMLGYMAVPTDLGIEWDPERFGA